MVKNKADEIYSDEEIARRRDDVIRRMANTPPKPHKPLGESISKSKPKPGARPNKRGRPSMDRA